MADEAASGATIEDVISNDINLRATMSPLILQQLIKDQFAQFEEVSAEVSGLRDDISDPNIINPTEEGHNKIIFTTTEIGIQGTSSTKQSPTYTLTSISELEKDTEFMDTVTYGTDVNILNETVVPITASSALVADNIDHNSEDSSIHELLTTYQEVISSQDTTTTPRPAPYDASIHDQEEKQSSQGAQVDLSYYNYDYYPDILQMSNILPPSQLASHSFNGANMNIQDEQLEPNIYDYYGDQLYIDNDVSA